jgi:hypothetical protein
LPDDQDAGWREARPDEDELELGAVSSGTPSGGYPSSFGRGLPFTDNMVVITTDWTATPLTEGGNLTDVSAAAASPSGSTFSFQGTLANHTIIIGVNIDDDISGDKIKFYGLQVLQTIAAVEIVKRSFAIEIWDGVQWSSVGVFSASEIEAYRYANEVFIRANSSETLHFGIESSTTWAKKLIMGNTLYWARIRITNSLTTAPVFEQFKVIPSGATAVNQEGIMEFRGLAKYRKTIQSAGNVFGESGGVTSGNVAVGAGGLPTGWSHETKNCTMNTSSDALYFQFTLPRGIDTSYPLSFRVVYIPTTSGGGLATCIFSCLPLEVAGVLEADPTGGLIPVPRTLANTETRTAKVGEVKTDAAVDVSQTLKMGCIEYTGYNISNYYEGDIILCRFETDNISGADIMVFAMEISGVMFTSGERI